MEYKGKTVWSEAPEIADDYRRAYIDGINNFIKNKIQAAKNLRREFMPPEELVKNTERYRAEPRLLVYNKVPGMRLFVDF